MRIGVMNGTVYSLPNFPVSLFSDVAVATEQLGYDGYFVNDHPNLPWGDETCEPYTELAYIAAKTSVIDLGNVVSPIPRYVPSYLAKMIAHIDILSKGRTLYAFGAGYREKEFVGFSPDGRFPPAKERVERTLEGAQLMKRLWTEDEVTFHGKYYHVTNAVLKPKPYTKPYPPMLSGGTGPYMRRMAAKFFDGWCITNWRWTAEGDWKAEGFRQSVMEMREWCKGYGRDPDKFMFMIEAGIEDPLKMVDAYAAAGCDYYVPSISPYVKENTYPFRYFPEQHIPMLKKFAKEVLPSFKTSLQPPP